VAIKTIRFGDTRKPEELDRMRERLFREARSAGILSHPGIVTIYDVDQQGDIAYIAMEYVDGPTLDQVLSESKPIASDRLFSILAQTGSALDYAHSKGIVHRDIKPANIMLAADGTSKITDFGIAKINTAEHLTMTGSIVGTPHYMSPEQVQGQHVDGRSDQFSLAVIAYEMLTGEKPYTGEHLTTVVYKIVAEDPLPAHRINPSLAGGIEGALRKAMAKKPDARYKTCQDFVETLEKAAAATKGWKPLTRGGLLHEPTMADVPAPEAQVPTKMLAPPRRSRRADATGNGTTTTRGKRKTGFFSFLLAAMVAAGLLALIGWQAAPYVVPWLQPPANEHQAAVPKDQAPPPAAQPETTPPASNPAAATAPTPVVPSPEDAKPSPTGPLTEEARPVEPPRPPAGAPPVRVAHVGPAQDVMVTTSPGGARASLEGDPEGACSTPCTLKAVSGKHTLIVMLPGYEMVRREFLMGNNPTELAPVILRAAGGTLMLTSDPKGASVSINGKRIDMVTPAQIPLAPGTYQITVEKDGRQSTAQVEIHNGINYNRISLDK
jgi:serine/threonine-protein kinase